ncbi:restriction endonuclease [Cupriavidus sp. WKF15]|uniref:restriction endonuclease n=1 Tax=Cupriavidus sp. WKF15 TaxID=3032282 RepID=UPI0023E2A9AB|nr:restriction endonuclease [Cupriavidus sp. WKF15]WER46057.1 restriction endonuclease [Cupriavidus sp. WKF15]
MARRKNASVFEDLFGLAALLPWWVGTVLAVVAYGVLHRYAVAEIHVQVQPGQIGQMVVGQMTKALATYGQYIVPFILLAGAAASFLKRRKRRGLVQDAASDRSGATLCGLNWRDFELLVGEAFRLRGYAVEETGGGGADGGVDLRLRKGNEVFLVQCKQWRAYKVSVTVVRELLGAMAAEGAAGGYVVTSGIFTTDAQSFAEGRNIRLIDGATLAKWIEHARAGGAVKRPGAPDEQRPPVTAPPAPSTQSSDPACPRCGGSMVRRIAKQGANAGNSFWGCATFPKCRGVRGL